MKRKLKKILLVLAAAAMLPMYGETVKFSPADTYVCVSPAAKKPSVDGKIQTDEYFGSFENAGLLKHNNPFLSSRQGKCFMAVDDKYLYWAMQTEMPDKKSGVELVSRYKRRDSKVHSDDNVELLLIPPGSKDFYQLILNPDNFSYDFKYPIVKNNVIIRNRSSWNPDLKVRSRFDKYWTIEVRIPLETLNVKNPAGLWRMQFGRMWRNPDQQTVFNRVFSFFDIDKMNKIEVGSDAPTVRFLTLGDNYMNGGNNLVFAVDNPTDKVQKLKYSIAVTSEAAPRIKQGEVVVEPRKSKKITLAFKESSNVNNELKVIFQHNNKTLYRRNFSWAYPLEKRWQAPDMTTSAELEFGIYPYYNKVRIRLGNQSTPCDMRKVQSASVYIADANGKAVGKKYTPEIVRNIGYKAEFPLGLNKKGSYFVVVDLKEKSGKVTTYKQKFEFDKFEWEHNKLGLDRVVIPPYIPLKYENSKVRTLLAEYTLKNGFFSAVKSGKADRLLAAPVKLSVNGRVPLETKSAWTEKSADYGINIAELKLDNVNFTVKNEFDFDNFVKTTLTVMPDKNFDFRSMTLDIPFNADFVQQIHSTCNTMRYNPVHTLPTRNGEIWNSKMNKIHATVSNNFRPYIWIGKLGEGMAFFAENDKNWSRDPAKPMAQIIRNGKNVTLRINFIDKSVVRSKPFEIVFGFQATPTRIRPNSSRQYTDRISAPNSLVCTVFAGSPRWSGLGFDFFPLNYDYSGITAMSKAKGNKNAYAEAKGFVDDFMKRNGHLVPQDSRVFFGRVMRVGFSFASFSDRIIPYLNPRATHARWPEFRVFMDEWYCSEYRANNEDAYNNTPTESYQDYVLFCMKKLLDAGMDGLYFDNVRDWQSPNSVTGPAYMLENGKVQPYFDIFAMRQLIRRTAIMLYKEGKTIFDGRPLFIHHMTNTNIVPFTSLCSTTLECEDKYGNTDFQTRFSEDYLRAGALGLQSGAIPEILLQITGNNNWVGRTFFAVTSVYDINAVMALSGLPHKPYYTLMSKLKTYGYGTDKVKVFPCFDMSGNIKPDADVRMVEYLHADGSRVIVISSFGYAGKVKFDCNFKFGKVTDFETDKVLQQRESSSYEFDLKKHDFRIFKLEK